MPGSSRPLDESAAEQTFDFQKSWLVFLNRWIRYSIKFSRSRSIVGQHEGPRSAHREGQRANAQHHFDQSTGLRKSIASNEFPRRTARRWHLARGPGQQAAARGPRKGAPARAAGSRHGNLIAVPGIVASQLQVCPFLLRAFVKEGGFHRFETFSAPLPKDDEVDVHTWLVFSLLFV